MNWRNNYLRIGVFLALIWGLAGDLRAEAETEGFAEKALIKSIRLGPHPEYTRILISLDRPTEYQVSADFSNKLVTLSFNNVAIAPGVQSKTYGDKNLQRIDVQRTEGPLTISLTLSNPNTRFFHYTDPTTSQIVLDLKGLDKPYLKTRIGKDSPAPISAQEGDISEPAKKINPHVKGMNSEQIQQALIKDQEDKLQNGWSEYEAALRAFQEQKFPEANALFSKYIKTYPDSRYLSDILYLHAESMFRIAYREPNPIYEKPLNAYKRAIRTFPNSKFADHALYKLAYIYDEMGYIIEARELYERGTRMNPRSIYNTARKQGLAAMLMKEDRYEEALVAFQSILKKSPKSPEAKTAIFDIANAYFDQKNYKRAIEIFEEGAERWPSELNERSEINYRMGEIYFGRKNYPKARKHYFDLINLAPESELSHHSLNRIGDSYLLEGQHMNALAVFDESAQRKPDSPESQYGLIRLADIGVTNPRLPVQDSVFKVTPYYQPFKTYDAVFKNGKDVNILAEVTLSRGIAYLKEQNHLKAINEFKKLLPLEKDSRFHIEAQKMIHQALVLLIDRYSHQEGVLPIIYSYTDYLSLSLGDVQNLKTLLQIGEAYQAIGMTTEAVKFYERVKQADAKGIYTDRIFLDLGRIHLSQNNPQEAELVARSFIKNYPRSGQIAEARKLLADSFKQQGNYDLALEEYTSLLATEEEDPARIHYLMAEAYDAQKKRNLAIQAYQKTIDTFDRKAQIIPPYVPEAYYNLGTRLFEANRFPEAAKALRTAIQLFPENPRKDWANYLLAEAFRTLKDPSQATTQFSDLAKSENSDDLLKKAAEIELKLMEWEKESKPVL